MVRSYCEEIRRSFRFSRNFPRKFQFQKFCNVWSPRITNVGGILSTPSHLKRKSSFHFCKLSVWLFFFVKVKAFAPASLLGFYFCYLLITLTFAHYSTFIISTPPLGTVIPYCTSFAINLVTYPVECLIFQAVFWCFSRTESTEIWIILAIVLTFGIPRCLHASYPYSLFSARANVYNKDGASNWKGEFTLLVLVSLFILSNYL